MLLCKRLESLTRDKTLELIGNIHKLQRKLIVVKTAPGAVFTALHFLRNLRIGLISFQLLLIKVFLIGKPFQPGVMKHSSLSA